MPLSPRASWNYTLVGWVLFTVSAACFTAEAVRSGGALYLVASVTFLLACLVFMVPVLLNRPGND